MPFPPNVVTVQYSPFQPMRQEFAADPSEFLNRLRAGESRGNMETENSTKPDTTEYAEQVRARIQKALPWAEIPEDPKLSKIAEYARRAGVNPGDWY